MPACFRYPSFSVHFSLNSDRTSSTSTDHSSVKVLQYVSNCGFSLSALYASPALSVDTFRGALSTVSGRILSVLGSSAFCGTLPALVPTPDLIRSWTYHGLQVHGRLVALVQLFKLRLMPMRRPPNPDRGPCYVRTCMSVQPDPCVQQTSLIIFIFLNRRIPHQYSKGRATPSGSTRLVVLFHSRPSRIGPQPVQYGAGLTDSDSQIHRLIVDTGFTGYDTVLCVPCHVPVCCCSHSTALEPGVHSADYTQVTGRHTADARGWTSGECSCRADLHLFIPLLSVPSLLCLSPLLLSTSPAVVSAPTPASRTIRDS